MSEEVESGPGAVPEGHVCPEGEMPDPDNPGQCIPVAEVQPDIDATGAVTTSEVSASLGLTPRIERTVKAYFKEMEVNFKTWMKTEFQRLKAESEVEAEEALRKSFGLEKDPVLRRSDLAKMIRATQLKTTDPSKRVSASPTTGTGPSGNIKQTSKSKQGKAIEALMKEYGVAK